MGKLHNIIKYIMWTPGHCKDFAKYQAEASTKDELFNYAELLLIKDRGVRQNSTYFMLVRAIKLRKEINKYMRVWRQLDKDATDLLQDTLTNADWVNVKRLIKILRPFI